MANTSISIEELLEQVLEHRAAIEPYQSTTSNNYIIDAEHLIGIIDLLVGIIYTYLRGKDKPTSKLENLQSDFQALVCESGKLSDSTFDGVYHFKTHLTNQFGQLNGTLPAKFIQLTGDGALTGENILINNSKGAQTIEKIVEYTKKAVDQLLNGSIQIGKFEALTLKTLNQDLMSGDSIKNLQNGTSVQDQACCTSFDTVACFNMPLSNTNQELLSFDKIFACGDYSLGVRLRLSTNNVTRGLDGGALQIEAFNGNACIGSWVVNRGGIVGNKYKTIHIPITHTGNVEIENNGINNKTVFNRNLSVKITALDSYQSGDVLYVDYVSVSPATIAVYDEVGTNNIQVGE